LQSAPGLPVLVTGGLRAYVLRPGYQRCSNLSPSVALLASGVRCAPSAAGSYRGMDDAPPPLKRKRGEERQQVDLPCLGGCCELPCACGAQSDPDEGQIASSEEVLLPGADDPSAAEQFALWKERRFIDIWLQVCRAYVAPRPLGGRSQPSPPPRPALAPVAACASPSPTNLAAGWRCGRARGAAHPGHAHAARLRLSLRAQAAAGLAGDPGAGGRRDVRGRGRRLCRPRAAGGGTSSPSSPPPAHPPPRPSTPAACACTSPAPPACWRS